MGFKTNDRGARLYPWPSSQKSRAMLEALLRGVEVDFMHAYMEWNLATPMARASEFRRMGWPVASLKKPHETLANEEKTVYYIDASFRRWWHTQNPEITHPWDYDYDRHTQN